MRILLPMLLLAAPALAQPTPRPFVVVEDSVVRLGDLFDAAGERAQVTLGPAPAPGSRLVVEARQLAAIARANRLDWRPSGGVERVVLERPGRALAREEVLLALRDALRQQGLEDDMDLDPVGFVAPMVPEGAFVRLAVEGAVLDTAGNRFGGTLAVLAEGQPTQRIRLGGRVVTTVPAVIATRRLGAGEVVRAGDMRVIRVAAGRLRPGAAQDPAQLVGQAMRRPAAAEQALVVADVMPRAVVQRGQTVVMVYEMPGIHLTAQGRAMEHAPRGAAVPVMNLASRVIVDAEVVEAGRVRVGFAR